MQQAVSESIDSIFILNAMQCFRGSTSTISRSFSRLLLIFFKGIRDQEERKRVWSVATTTWTHDMGLYVDENSIHRFLIWKQRSNYFLRLQDTYPHGKPNPKETHTRANIRISIRDFDRRPVWKDSSHPAVTYALHSRLRTEEENSRGLLQV